MKDYSFGSVAITAGAGAAFTLPDELDFGAVRDLGVSDGDPVLVVDLANADAGASSRYKVEILHGDATGPTNVLASYAPILNPVAGCLIEIPFPRKHRRFVKVKITTTGAAITANSASAYIQAGGAAGHISAKMPD